MAKPRKFLTVEGSLGKVRVDPSKERKKFTARSLNIYHGMRSRLAKKIEEEFVLDFTLEDFRNKMREALLRECKYCNIVMKADLWSADHIIPLSRGGSAGLDNLEAICGRCNRAKSDLTSEEYTELVRCLSSLGPAAKESVLRRLSSVPTWLKRF